MPYSWRYASLGFLLSVVTAAICWPLPDDLCFGILAIFLGAIAGVYIGIALAVADRNLIVVETVIGFLFLVLAAAGWFVSPLVLALGYFLHGFWDLVHHPRYLRSPGPAWYQPMCLAFDWGVASYIVARELGARF